MTVILFKLWLPNQTQCAVVTQILRQYYHTVNCHFTQTIDQLISEIEQKIDINVS